MSKWTTKPPTALKLYYKQIKGTALKLQNMTALRADFPKTDKIFEKNGGVYAVFFIITLYNPEKNLKKNAFYDTIKWYNF